MKIGVLSAFRLDWHLLSTATPSINAWLKSGNRFQEVLVTLIKMSHRRTCAVLGCLMADALDRQDIHMPVKVSLSTSLKYKPLLNNKYQNGFILSEKIQIFLFFTRASFFTRN